MWIRRLSELALVATCVLAPALAWAAPPAGDDPFSDYRDRFKLGMDRYTAGAFAEAVGYWEPIYGELGEQRGYRLAYDLGVAYEELGETTKGAERLQSFLAQAEARRQRGETLPAIVDKEEASARDRIAALTASKGRIHVDPGSPPRPVQVDAMEPRVSSFVAWLSPGKHTVTFAAGTADARSTDVEVHPGEIVDVAPPAPPTPAPAPPAAPTQTAARAPVPAPASSSAPATPPARETHHPFPAAILYVGAGLTLAAGVASIPLDSNAWSLRDNYTPGTDGSSFYSARSLAYGTLGAAVGLGMLTAGLATWYLLGTTERDVVVTPGGVAGRF